jgi:hypothetical protein
MSFFSRAMIRTFYYAMPWICTLGSLGYTVYLYRISLFPAILGIKKSAVNPVAADPESQYIARQKDRLLTTFSMENHGSNSSIEPTFYSINKYDLMIQDPKNELEAAWKRRILMESTPRGSVVMYYDAFKRGFAYYSDQYIPYPLINAVCMKYVVVYRCRDFFLDETVLSGQRRSPFLAMMEEEERLEKEKKVATNKEYGLTAIDIRKGPFAKLKQKTGAKISAEMEKILPGVQKQIEDKIHLGSKDISISKNRIIHLGKWANFSILNKTGSGSLVSKKQADIPMKFKDYMALKIQL